MIVFLANKLTNKSEDGGETSNDLVDDNDSNGENESYHSEQENEEPDKCE